MSAGWVILTGRGGWSNGGGGGGGGGDGKGDLRNTISGREEGSASVITAYATHQIC